MYDINKVHNISLWIKYNTENKLKLSYIKYIYIIQYNGCVLSTEQLRKAYKPHTGKLKE